MKVEQNPIAQSLLEQIRQHQQQINETRIEAGFEIDSGNRQVNFSDAVGSALKEVNALKMSSSASAAAYESGVDIPLSDVMVDMQKDIKKKMAEYISQTLASKIPSSEDDLKNETGAVYQDTVPPFYNLGIGLP